MQCIVVLLMQVVVLGGLNIAELLFLVQVAWGISLLMNSQERETTIGHSGQRTIYQSRVLNHAYPILSLMRMMVSGNLKRVKPCLSNKVRPVHGSPSACCTSHERSILDQMKY